MCARDLSRGTRAAPKAKAAATRFASSNGQAMEPALRARLEDRFGWNFANVRLHADNQAATANNAAAFTIGPDIVFAPGRLQPSDPRGVALLSHELAHVVQQERGAARAAGFASPAALEAEANAVALQPTLAVAGAAPPSVMQRQTPEDEPPISAGELQSMTHILRLATIERTGGPPQGLQRGAIGTYRKGVANPHPAAVESNPSRANGGSGPAGRAPQRGREDAGVYLEHQMAASIAREVLPNYRFFGPKGQAREGIDVKEALTIVFGDASKAIKDPLDRSLLAEIKSRKARGEQVPLIEVLVRGAQHSQEATAGPDWEETAGQITRLFEAEKDQSFDPKFGHEEIGPGKPLTGPNPLEGVSDAHLDRVLAPHLKPFAPPTPTDKSRSAVLDRARARSGQGGFVSLNFGRNSGPATATPSSAPPPKENVSAAPPKENSETLPPKENDSETEQPKESRSGAILGGAIAGANQAAALLRAYDSYDDARAQNKSALAATFSAAGTYLKGTIPELAAVTTFPDAIAAKKHAGQDDVEAVISSAGEAIGGLLPGGIATSHVVGAGANLIQATQEHRHKGKPGNAGKPGFSVSDGASLVSQVVAGTPQIIGAGGRAYYDLGKALAGDTSGVEHLGRDAAAGDLGPLLQPIGMVADIAGNLGSGQGLEHAVEKTVKAGENSLLGRAGGAVGDLAFEGVTAVKDKIDATLPKLDAAAESIKKKARSLLPW